MSASQRSLLRRVTGWLGGIQKRRLWRRGFRESLATDAWTEDDIRRHDDTRLVALVRDAATHIPFYRDLYNQAGVDAAAFRGVEDLASLPTIEKRDLVESGDRMVRPGVADLAVVRHTTGGSTGTIATMVSPRGLSSWESGCIYALWHRVGVARGDRMVVLRGALIDEGQSLFRREPGGRSLTVSTYHLNDDNVGAVVDLIDGFRPDWLHVYPSAVTLLANILRRTGRRLGVPVKGVLCGSEMVYAWQVDLFREVFGGIVYSHYGHGELGILGGWCKGRREFHFLPNHGYLELLDEAGRPVTEPGVVGEMTSTGYANTVMPLIRYRTADYGAWSDPGPCPDCGRSHARLAEIEGRIQEYLVLADGTRFPLTNINALHGMFFSYVYRFQFVQDAPGEAVLRFVPAVEMTPGRMEEIRQAFAYLGEMGLRLEFEPVERIDMTRTGKQRLVVRSEEVRP